MTHDNNNNNEKKKKKSEYFKRTRRTYRWIYERFVWYEPFLCF
jgi:hypothetical protein